jgi:hypothetical protein
LPIALSGPSLPQIWGINCLALPQAPPDIPLRKTCITIWSDDANEQPEQPVLLTGVEPAIPRRGNRTSHRQGAPGALLIIASRTPSNLDALAERLRESLDKQNPAASGGAKAAAGATSGTVVKTVVLDYESLAAV